ncbi:unnamed protein product [Diamesa tonsa]
MENKNYIVGKLVPKLLKEKIIYIEGTDEREFINIDSVVVDDLADVGFALTKPYSVKVKLSRYSERDNVHEFNLVVKITPKVPEDVYRTCQFDILFANEATAYTDIIPALGHVENFPKYYYSERENDRAVMVLGNFAVNGWRMSKSVINLDLNHILVAVRELGQFHGACYALKETNHGLFDIIIKAFRESRFSSDCDEIYNACLKVSPKRGTQAVRENVELKRQIPEEFLHKIDELSNDPWPYLKAKVEPREPLAIICHGDFLRNNVAFKYDENEPHAPTNAMMFDFQTLRYSSPMVDLAIFLANSTGADIRFTHFSFIFKTYHEEVIKTLMFKLNKFRQDIPEIYSYDNFLREYARLSMYGYIIASSFLQILHDPEEGIDWAAIDRTVGIEWFVQKAYKQGGEPVNFELCGLICDMWKLHQKLNIDLE